jgi:hypothetical protein
MVAACISSRILPLTFLTLGLFQISSVACLACLCSSGTVKVGLFMLPLVGRLRLMMFVTVFSLLVTCLFIFLDISHIVYFFPFIWGKLVSSMVSCLWLLSYFLSYCFYLMWVGYLLKANAKILQFQTVANNSIGPSLRIISLEGQYELERCWNTYGGMEVQVHHSWLWH